MEMGTDKPLGCAMRVDHLLDGLEGRVQSILEQLENARKRQLEAEFDLEKGNPYVPLVEDLEQELSEIDRKLAEPDEKSA